MTFQVEATAPHTRCYGCSSLEGVVGLSVMSQPGGAEPETVVKLEEKGVA